jgi:uncharacterized membrane protein
MNIIIIVLIIAAIIMVSKGIFRAYKAPASEHPIKGDLFLIIFILFAMFLLLLAITLFLILK